MEKHQKICICKHCFRIDPIVILIMFLLPTIILCAIIGAKLGSLQASLIGSGRTATQAVEVQAVETPTEVTITVQNSSTDTWTATENFLIPARPSGRSSALYVQDSWVDTKHIAMEESSVAPGKVATFTFTVQAPKKDLYREYFAVAKKDGTPYGETENALDVVVEGVRYPEALQSVTWSTSGTALKAIVGDLGKIPTYSLTAPYAYSIDASPASVSIAKLDTHDVTIKLKNLGSTIWYRDANVGDHPLRLGTARSRDRASKLFDDATWLSAGRIPMQEAFVMPGQTATFAFTMQAPDKDRAYREYFAPVVEGVTWMEEGTPIMIDVAVGTGDLATLTGIDMSRSPGAEKLIKINLSTQQMQTFEDGELLQTYTVSTGKWSLPTPTGTFKIQNHATVAYSKRYALYMDNWMAFTPSGAYGIHSLPYWKLKNGGKYTEEEQHLGRPVSHGCVRLSFENSKALFDWAEDKTTTVEIFGTTPR